MDSFFGWTAAALTAYYLAGRDVLENDIPIEVSSQGESVSSLISPNE